MKHTNFNALMVVVFSILFSWLAFSVIAWLVSDDIMKECISNPAVVFFTFVVGWIPALTILCDWDEEEKKLQGLK